jgi:hypothetical protein
LALLSCSSGPLPGLRRRPCQRFRLKAGPSPTTTTSNPFTIPGRNKIGDIDDVLVDDVLVDKAGKITALMGGVGGFLGVGEKDVAVPFSAVKNVKKNDKRWLTLDESKDTLKNAAGYKYDKAFTTWLADKKIAEAVR